jgi:Cytochrome C oxidase, cbb3-type, subunit III
MTNPSRLTTALLATASLTLVVVASVSVGAQPKEDPRSILDRVYSVAQAERGEQRFKQSCSSCHAATDFAGGAMSSRWEGQTLGDVFDYVSTSMPENDPGGLKPEDYASVLAFFLHMDGYPVGLDDLPADKGILSKFGIVANPK